MLKLRSTGIRDYSVLEGGQRIGRIRLATEHMPCVWPWNVTIHLGGGLPMGSAKDLDSAKAEFKGLGAPFGQDHARAAGGSLQGLEYSGRRLKDGPWRPAIIGRSSAGHKRARQHASDSHPGACGCG
jgi:hypothetical protein